MSPNTPKATPKKRGVVYFVQAGSSTGPIKIGYSINLKKRLDDLQTANHEQLTLLGVIPGCGLVDETKIHQQFSPLNIHGEWFYPAKPLRDFIKAKTSSYVGDKMLDEDGFDPLEFE